MRALNDVVRFVLELCALAALGYWGFHTGSGIWGWALGLGAPVGLAVVWGLFMSPKASIRLRDPARILAEVAIFATAVAALAQAGRPSLAVAFGVVVAAHLALTFPFGQR